MATIINNPGNDESGGLSMIIGFVVLLMIGVLFFVYGLPAIQDAQKGGVDVNITVPRNDGVVLPQ